MDTCVLRATDNVFTPVQRDSPVICILYRARRDYRRRNGDDDKKRNDELESSNVIDVIGRV